MRIPKTFISLGKSGNSINIDCLVLDKCYEDKEHHKAVLFDKFGIKYVVDMKLVKGKVELNG